MFEGKIETIKNMIVEHDNSLFSRPDGQITDRAVLPLQYNSDTIHSITTDRHSRECYPADWRPRYKAAYPIGLNKSRSTYKRRKETKRKVKRRKGKLLGYLDLRRS